MPAIRGHLMQAALQSHAQVDSQGDVRFNERYSFQAAIQRVGGCRLRCFSTEKMIIPAIAPIGRTSHSTGVFF